MKGARVPTLAMTCIFISSIGACSKKETPPQQTSATVPLVTAVPSGSGERHKRGHEDRHEAPDDRGAPLALEARVGATSATWTKPSFDKVARYTQGTDGEGRDVWSLRELAHTLVGPTARVVAIIGPEGSKRLDRTSWNDATRTPILHTTRRGTLKFRWANPAGTWGDTEVTDVARLEIEP